MEVILFIRQTYQMKVEDCTIHSIYNICYSMNMTADNEYMNYKRKTEAAIVREVGGVKG